MNKAFTKSRIMGYMLLLTVASLCVAALSYARYSTKVSGAATAVVAAWGSDYTTDTANIIDVSGLTPGSSLVYKFRVTNEKDGKVSEVAQSYFVTVETTGNLPLTFTLSLENSPSAGSAVAVTDASRTLSFINNKSVSDGGSLPPAVSVSHNYILTVSWPQDQNGEKYAGEIDQVSLTVNAQQILPKEP